MVGVCAALERARWTVWDTEANLSPRVYSTALSAAGARTVILPADDALAAAADEALELVDGLIVAGGGDIDPAIYGEPARPETYGIRPERDRFELALAEAALDRDLPLLGVCRGMEVLNVALGGTLVQQLETPDAHLRTPGSSPTTRSSSSPARWPPARSAASGSRCSRTTTRGSRSSARG